MTPDPAALEQAAPLTEASESALKMQVLIKSRTILSYLATEHDVNGLFSPIQERNKFVLGVEDFSC